MDHRWRLRGLGVWLSLLLAGGVLAGCVETRRTETRWRYSAQGLGDRRSATEVSPYRSDPATLGNQGH